MEKYGRAAAEFTGSGLADLMDEAVRAD
jgi:hypothetical protein